VSLPASRTFAAATLAATICVAACAKKTPESALFGHWEGGVDFGEVQMPVILDVDRIKEGEILAEADLPDQGIEDFLLEIHADEDSVWIGIESPEPEPEIPEMRGKLSPDRKRITGDFRQDGDAFAFELTRTGDPRLSRAPFELETASLDSMTIVSPDSRELRDRFNEDAGKTRLLLLLSPT
jgi:hypothetical protein